MDPDNTRRTNLVEVLFLLGVTVSRALVGQPAQPQRGVEPFLFAFVLSRERHRTRGIRLLEVDGQ